ncbi:MAG: DUF3048 domain-containing protein [Anaerolineae bacterium]|nr:DUF3048 domain-containing protein [Anaerolineae bacterium]
MPRRAVLTFVLLLLTLLPLSAQETSLIGPYIYPPGVNPLTGLEVDDPTLLNRRPLLVKISDYPAIVRPQSGLNQADIVWEHLLAGGVTRFSAIYLGRDVEKVGPIRSGRLIDFELTRIYRSLFVYSGMAQGTIDVLRGDGLVSSRAIGGSDPCPALCRYPREGVALEHTLFGDTAALRELAIERDRDVTPEPIYGMAFSEALPEGGQGVMGINVNYAETQIEWRYNAETGRFERGQDGEAQIDEYDGQPVSADNVVILEEEHTVQPKVSDGYWGPGDFAFSVNFIGSGRIFLLRDGQYFEGEWRREERDEPLSYYDMQGNILPFKPGRTFINLVPRWIDGYQLTFFLEDAPEVSVQGTLGINMRVGPGDAYVALDVAYPGDTFMLTGRNKAADWVQLIRDGQGAVWMQPDALGLSISDILSLPIVRPTNER